MKVNVFWFRRDLRLHDNTALCHALAEGLAVLPVFIFDDNITGELPADDARISFIYDNLSEINISLRKAGSSILVLQGDPVGIWNRLISEYDINAVFVNKDYEPYAISRDRATGTLLREKGIQLKSFKDQVIFEEREILKSDRTPYTIFTPYKNQWLREFISKIPDTLPTKKGNYLQTKSTFPSLEDLGFMNSVIKAAPYDLSAIENYDKYRDFPAADKTTHLGPHLRFGTVSIREIVKLAAPVNEVFLSELIWREFFMQILFNFPGVVTSNFRAKYNNIQWRNNDREFERWCKGETGYSLVDAGMRQLNESGYMHNRVRMIAAGFLCKHLLTDWRWGEAYFAEKLLDYELSSNNGNWQWAAGTGCDAAPYFRVFNPETQLRKFDHNKEYARRWVKDIDEQSYPDPIVDHESARNRAIQTYKSGLFV
jgi:deoxyribodipyrimidine photo-lyase